MNRHTHCSLGIIYTYIHIHIHVYMHLSRNSWQDSAKLVVFRSSLPWLPGATGNISQSEGGRLRPTDPRNQHQPCDGSKALGHHLIASRPLEGSRQTSPKTRSSGLPGQLPGRPKPLMNPPGPTGPTPEHGGTGPTGRTTEMGVAMPSPERPPRSYRRATGDELQHG